MNILSDFKAGVNRIFSSGTARAEYTLAVCWYLIFEITQSVHFGKPCSGIKEAWFAVTTFVLRGQVQGGTIVNRHSTFLGGG